MNNLKSQIGTSNLAVPPERIERRILLIRGLGAVLPTCYLRPATYKLGIRGSGRALGIRYSGYRLRDSGLTASYPILNLPF